MVLRATNPWRAGSCCRVLPELGRRDGAGLAGRKIAVHHPDQRPGARIRQRPQQQRVDDAEDRRVGANSDAQHQHDGRGEQRSPPERARRQLQFSSHLAHRPGPPAGSVRHRGSGAMVPGETRAQSRHRRVARQPDPGRPCAATGPAGFVHRVTVGLSQIVALGAPEPARKATQQQPDAAFGRRPARSTHVVRSTVAAPAASPARGPRFPRAPPPRRGGSRGRTGSAGSACAVRRRPAHRIRGPL